MTIIGQRHPWSDAPEEPLESEQHNGATATLRLHRHTATVVSIAEATGHGSPHREQDVVDLSIVMPCLDEAMTLRACISKAHDFLARSALRGEIVVADNGSTDGSQDVARSLGARVIEVPERGYGNALRSGIEAARGRFVVMGDSDDSYDFSRIDALVDELSAGADLVVGNRFAGGIDEGAMPFLHRYLGNPVLSFLGRRLFGVRIGDFHCGLRGARREAVSGLGLHTPGMEFATEMVAGAATAGLVVVEVPVALHRDGRDRSPHLRTWRDGFRHLHFMFGYRLRLQIHRLAARRRSAAEAELPPSCVESYRQSLIRSTVHNERGLR